MARRTTADPGMKARIGVGLIALGGDSALALDKCREWLQGYFEETFPEFSWKIQKENWDDEWAEPLLLFDNVQAQMESEGWQFSFILSDIRKDMPSYSGLGVLSFSHSAAIINLPDLVAPREAATDTRTVTRCCNLILVYFARLNGLPHLEENNMKARDLDGGVPLSAGEIRELDGSLCSLADGILRRGVKEIRGLALYARLALSHPMRILRSVFSHRPLRMVFSLGKLVFAAMAALVLALLSTELWHLGVGINTWRLILIALAALLAATIYLVFKQDLYVRKVSRSLSEQAAFFNLTSFLTVFTALLLLFIIIFMVTMVVTVGVYPRYIVEDWLGKVEMEFLDYVKVSLLISSMAMVVGALGAGLEENRHFRQVMYTEKNR